MGVTPSADPLEPPDPFEPPDSFEPPDPLEPPGPVDRLDLVDPLRPAGGPPIVTPGNARQIAAVLADPRRAWLSEPTFRKAAAVRFRGVEPRDGTDVAELDHQLERLMGEDDMVPAIWLDRAIAASDAVAMIRTPLGAATGFLVSNDLLLTNWHVFETLESARDPGVSAVFRYQEDENLQIVSAVRLGLDPERFFLTGDSELDFALVAVQPLPGGRAPGTEFGRIILNSEIGKSLLGQPLNIVQHPGGRPRKLAFRRNLLVNLDDPTRLIYQTDTMPGSSGSPVFNDEWQLVALHHRAEHATDSRGRLIDRNGDPVTSSTPERLQHWIANAGIRVSRIVAHLRTLDLPVEQAALLNAAITPP